MGNLKVTGYTGAEATDWSNRDQMGPSVFGGSNNPFQDPTQLYDLQNNRLGAIGAPTQATNLPAWMQTQQGNFQNYANQSQALQQQQYQQAQQLASGVNTPGQQQLQQQQQGQNAALSSMARGAGGGARGAAAAQGTAVQAGGQNAGMQAQQQQMQQLSDKAAGSQLMAGIANQQQALQGQEYGLQAQQGEQNAAYQQGWQGMNDTAALFGNTMQANEQAANLGVYNNNANSYQQNLLQQQQQTNQLIGAGIGAAGAWGAQAGRDQSNPTYTSDETLKDPFTSDHGAEDRLLDTLTKSKSIYSYKNKSDEPHIHPNGGAYLGVMAQDLEKTDTGKQLVITDDRGRKMVQLGPMVSALSAGLGRINQRLRALEDTDG